MEGCQFPAARAIPLILAFHTDVPFFVVIEDALAGVIVDIEVGFRRALDAVASFVHLVPIHALALFRLLVVDLVQP